MVVKTHSKQNQVNVEIYISDGVRSISGVPLIVRKTRT